MNWVNYLRDGMKRIRSCEFGAVAPLVAICVIVLVGSAGMAIDLGRDQMAQSKLQAALDSAGLAAGAVVGRTVTADILKLEARKYLDANFVGETVTATITEFDLTLSQDKRILTLDARASLPTVFMMIFGHQSMQVAAHTEVTRDTTGLEVAVVVDVTGSMCQPCQKLADLKMAATDFVNILFGSDETVNGLWIGMVPFSQSVNVGTDKTAWSSDYALRAAKDNCVGPTSGSPMCAPATTLSPTISLDSPTNPNVSTRTNPVTLVDDWLVGNPANWYFKPHAWSGCFEERYTTGRDVTDDPPSMEQFKVYFWPDMSNGQVQSNNWLNNSNGNRNISASSTSADTWANKGCPRQTVTPMVNTKSTLLTAIGNFQSVTNHYTHINVGAAWGWRLLSPNWRGVWGGTMNANNLPLDYDEPSSQKAVVVMSDGMNTATDYTAFGRITNGVLGSTNPSSSRVTGTLDDKLTTICTSMKNAGIIVYTVLFQNNTQSAEDVMQACASQEDFFFDTTTGADLRNAFRTIGDSLSKLRISR